MAVVWGTAMAVVWFAIARDGGGRLTVRPSFLARGTSTTDNGDDEHIFRQDCALEPSEWPEWLRPRATSAGIALPAIHGSSRSQARSPELDGGIIKEQTKHTNINARWRRHHRHREVDASWCTTMDRTVISADLTGRRISRTDLSSSRRRLHHQSR